MLFATFGGLSIYDGVTFHNYSREDGLANELVNDVIEISQDSLLIATNASALNVLVDGNIKYIETDDNFCPVINRFHKSHDGFLYVVADDGLFKMAGNKFVRLPMINSDGQNIARNLDRIVEWNDYFFMIPWNIPQHEKLIIYDKLNQKVIGSITDKRVISVAVSSQNELWVSSTSGIETLDLSALRKGQIKLIPEQNIDPILGWKNSFLYFDPAGNSWMFENNEAVRFTTTGEKQSFSTQQGLKTSNLAKVFVDREGIIWMGSDGNGVVKIAGTNVQILSELISDTKNNIFTMYHRTDTTWVFNITDNSIYRIHKNIVTPFPLGNKPMIIWNLYSAGQSLYFIANNHLHLVRNKDLSSSYLDLITIIPDSSPIVEIGTGLTDPNGMAIQPVRQDDSTFYLAVIQGAKVLMKSPLSFMGDQMAIDRENRLWVALRNDRLLVYSLHPESPSQYLQLLYDYSDKIKGISPRSIVVDNTGDAWIGTRFNGIYKLDFEKNKFVSSYQFTTAKGLTDNFIYYLHCAPNNEIWAGSQTGMDKIFWKNGQYIIENITKSKAIFQGINKIINVNDHEIWAMTTSGNILTVSRDTLAKNNPPPLLITSLAANDQKYNVTTTSFPYDHNNISVSVAASSFLDEKSIQYSYLLEGGTSTKWSDPSNNAHFNFMNLAPSNYTLHIKAQFPAHIYPAQVIKYGFTITPPFWKTLWFLLLAGILVLTILGWMVRNYYINKLERQKIFLESRQAIEKERTRIATDMHDDLGAGLSRIKFLSEIIGIKKQKQLPIEEEINNIRHHAHDMIDKMGEIVWALNEKNDSLSDLLSFTRAYAVEYLAENGIEGSIDKIPIVENRIINGEFRRNIYLSVKEALHNVVKHSRADHVNIRFNSSHELLICIHDNGVGFDMNNISAFRNGLTNIKKRMSDIGGKMDIINDHGTHIILTAPLTA